MKKSNLSAIFVVFLLVLTSSGYAQETQNIDISKLTPDMVNNLDASKVDSLLGTQTAIDKLKSDEFWSKINKEKKDLFFQKKFSAFSDKADDYFNEKLKTNFNGFKYAPNVQYKEGILINGRSSIDTKHLPVQLTRADNKYNIEVTDGSFTLVNPSNKNEVKIDEGKIVDESPPGVVTPSFTIAHADGSKVKIMFDERFSGQEVYVNRGEYNLRGGGVSALINERKYTQYVPGNKIGSVIVESPNHIRADNIQIEGNGVKIYVPGGELQVGANKYNIPTTEVYFDDSNHFIYPARFRDIESHVLATQNGQFIQLTSNGNINMAGAKLGVEFVEPKTTAIKITAEGNDLEVVNGQEYVVFDGNKISRQWISPQQVKATNLNYLNRNNNFIYTLGKNGYNLKKSSNPITRFFGNWFYGIGAR